MNLRNDDAWNPIVNFRDEEGNIESALVLIPLLFLFLISAQIILALHMTKMDQALVQGSASARAISGERRAGDEVIEIPSPDRFSQLKILITHRQRVIPMLLPPSLLGANGNFSTDVVGGAVIEGSN